MTAARENNFETFLMQFSYKLHYYGQNINSTLLYQLGCFDTDILQYVTDL